MVNTFVFWLDKGKDVEREQVESAEALQRNGNAADKCTFTLGGAKLWE